jgi:predicted nucleotidyltransferase component of viral defense system
MDLSELRRISAKEELSLNFIAKDERISSILAGLQGIEGIILKGGTAINRVYLKNKRFSEDIDFDITSKGNAKQILPKTKGIVKKLGGFRTAKPRIMRDTIRYDLYYTNPLEHQDRIMLEFKPTKKPQAHSRRIVNFGFVPHEAALLEVYDIEALINQKIDCMMNRTEGKDFYDLYHLLELPHHRLDKLKEGKKEILNRMNLGEKQVKAIANAMNHYLPRNQRPNWTLFLEELREKIRNY